MEIIVFLSYLATVIILIVLLILKLCKGTREEDEFICKYCGNHYSSWEFLIIHLKNNHFDEIENDANENIRKY